jgi:hypothetical protein
MTIVFTICSVNYLAQAKTLGDSLIKHNKNYKFIIGLLDKLDSFNFDKNLVPPYEIIEVESLTNIDNFDYMNSNYNIIEFNTAVKPYYFDHLMKIYDNAKGFIYLDPDIMVFNNFSYLEDNLRQHDIILTPHICTPIKVETDYKEGLFLNHGIYNLGFIALKKNSNTQAFIDWWKGRLRENCIIDTSNGIFVDQLPINFVPIYFDNVYVSKNMGLNMAYWNLHERKINEENGVFYVNETPLVFFHFSSFVANGNAISKIVKYYTFENRPDLLPLAKIYAEEMTKNHHKSFKIFASFYGVTVKKNVLYYIKKFLYKAARFTIRKFRLYY